MIKQGILKEANELTNWVSFFVAVKKPGKLRICMDPKVLNKALKHNHYYTKTSDDILPKQNFFSFRCKRQLSSNRIRR